MSIADKITRLAAAKNAIAAAITEKGGTVADGDGFEEFAADIGTITGGGGDQPQLHAPTLNISEDTLTITPNTANGDFVTGWKGYAAVEGGTFELFGTLPVGVTSLDLTAQSLPEDVYRFKATAAGDNFQDSADSNIVNYTNIFYSVTNTLTNCTSNNSATSVRKGSAYAATLTASSGHVLNAASVTVTMGGADITSTAYSNGVISIAAITGELVIVASAIEITDVDFATASWADIQYAALNFGIANTFGDQVGATRSVTLKNGSAYTLQLVNATDDLYERSGGGNTGLVVQFVELWSEKKSMGSANNWRDSTMRTTVMPSILAQLPDDIAAVVASVKLIGCTSGKDGTLITTEDSIFIPTAKEVFSSDYTQYVGRQEEWNANGHWQYYAGDAELERRKKKIGSTATAWYIRSQYNDMLAFSGVRAEGYVGIPGQNFSSSIAQGVSPCFCI